jgi:8-oxo-dGTP pyrophosphatase MutT (NUDIX family)
MAPERLPAKPRLVASDDLSGPLASEERPDYIAVTRHLLSMFEPARLTTDRRSRAAVLVPLYEKHGVQSVVVTKRTDLVEHHKGEISLPGGAMDEADNDVLTTALRETHEEIGVDPDHVEVLGSLDDIVTITNFHVTPIVGVITEAPYPFAVREDEVAELIEIPLQHLLDPDTLVEEKRERDGQQYINFIYRYEGHEVWGATGRILHQYLELLTAGLELDLEDLTELPPLSKGVPGYS